MSDSTLAHLRALLAKATKAKAELAAAALPPESARLYCAEGHCVWSGPRSESAAHLHTECPHCGEAWWDQDEEDRVLISHPFQNSPAEFNAEASARMEFERAVVDAAPALLRVAEAAKQLLAFAEAAQVQHSAAQSSMHDDCPECRILANAKAALREMEGEP